MKIKVLSVRIRRYVEFRSTYSSLTGEKRCVRSRSLRRLDIPTHTKMFFFFNEGEVTVQFGRQVVVWSKLVEGSESPMYYYGEVYNWAKIHREFPGEKSILSPSSTARALRTLLGSWSILDKGNRVVSPTTRQVTVVR